MEGGSGPGDSDVRGQRPAAPTEVDKSREFFFFPSVLHPSVRDLLAGSIHSSFLSTSNSCFYLSFSFGYRHCGYVCGSLKLPSFTYSY